MSALSVIAAAAEAPDADALCVQGDVLRFGELAERVGEAQPRLSPTAGPCVVLTPRLDLESVCAMLACLEFGLPMLLLHPRFTAAERERAVAEVAKAWVEGPRFEGAGRHASSTLAVVFTSGSGAAPRAAVLSRGAFRAAAQASAANLGWEAKDRWLLSMPPAHVGGLSILVRCLLARRAMVLADSTAFDPAGLARQLARDDVTLLSLVPSMLRRLLDHDAGWSPPSCLRAVLVGGAAMPVELRARAAARGVPLLTTYGMTETCAQVATQTYASRGRVREGVGPALPGVCVRTRGGQIEVSGPSLMDGYVGLSVEQQPFSEDGWLRTGDLGRIDGDGWLHVEGRADDLIISGGENVSPREVEEALLSLPGVRAAVVFGRPDEQWGQRVCAALVLAAPPPELGALWPPLRAKLATHKLPRHVAVLDALPFTAKGEVDRSLSARSATEAGLEPWPSSSP